MLAGLVRTWRSYRARRLLKLYGSWIACAKPVESSSTSAPTLKNALDLPPSTPVTDIANTMRRWRNIPWPEDFECAPFQASPKARGNGDAQRMAEEIWGACDEMKGLRSPGDLTRLLRCKACSDKICRWNWTRHNVVATSASPGSLERIDSAARSTASRAPASRQSRILSRAKALHIAPGLRVGSPNPAGHRRYPLKATVQAKRLSAAGSRRAAATRRPDDIAGGPGQLAAKELKMWQRLESASWREADTVIRRHARRSL